MNDSLVRPWTPVDPQATGFYKQVNAHARRLRGGVAHSR